MTAKLHNRLQAISVMTAILFGILAFLPFSTTVSGSYPLVRNHTKQSYGADTQNWDIIQDNSGRMIFANKRGVLIYDGERWELIHLDNYGAARSLASDNRTGRIYVGGSGSMGYLEPDPASGVYIFRKLTPDDMDHGADIGNIWNIEALRGSWWFQGDYNVYRYDGRSTVTIPVGSKINCSGVIGGALHVATQEGQLYRIDGARLTELTKSDNPLAGKSVRAIISHPTEGGKGLVVTASDGCMTLGPDGLRPFDTGIDHMLAEAQVFCAEMKRGTVIFGTVSSGAIIKDFKTGRVSVVDRGTGMQNNTVLSAAFDRQDNIWLGLDNGIDYVLHNAPVRRLLPLNTDCGSGYTSLPWAGRLLLGTNQGLFSIPYPAYDGSQPSRLLRGQVWGLVMAGNSLLACTDLGLYAGTPDNLRRVPGVGGTWYAGSLNTAGDSVLVSTYDRYLLLTRDPDGSWRKAGDVGGFTDTHGWFRIMPDGSIWISDWQKGLFRLHLDRSRLCFTDITHFSERHGLPVDHNISFERIGDDIVVSSDAGFSTLTPGAGRFTEAEGIFSLIRGEGPTRLHQAPDGSVWTISADKIVKLEKRDGRFVADSTTYNMLHTEVIPGFDHLSFLPGTVIMSAESGFYELKPRERAPVSWMPSLFISRITLDHDSIFQAPVNGQITAPGTIPYKCASVIFEAACTEHRMKDAVRYSFLLEGYDREWSPYSRQPSKEYTRLPAGDYTLRVRAVDSYDNSLLESEYKFTVATPWYLSVGAVIVYILLALASIGVAVLLALRYSRESANKVMATKDKEISAIRREALAEQKRKDTEIKSLHSRQIEQEIIHRSETLSASTKHAVARNETLLGISESLEELKREIPADSQQNVRLSKNIMELQEKISKAMSTSDDMATMTRNFDRVYGDYVERLTYSFPTLTKSEIRLCCYIKMGLSTKEIAPLLNVAPKSIEMSRYRLRKKLSLDRAVNLSDYLENF